MFDDRTADFKTHCNFCFFARKVAGIQIGCKLDRIDKFRNRGIKIDDTPNGYVVNTFCNTCRPVEWAENKDDPVKAVYKEAAIKMDYIIIENTSDKYIDVISKLEKTINNLRKQKSVNRVVFVHNNSKTKPKHVIDWLKKNAYCSYRVVSSIDEISELELIDLGVKNCNGNYYCCITNGDTLYEYLSFNLNKAINEDLLPVSLVTSGTLTGLTSQVLLHKTLGGNVGMTIQEKIIELAKEQNSLSLIKKWDELCYQKLES